MIAACKSGVPENFFKLQTSDARSIVAGSSPQKQKALFSQYCDFTRQSVVALNNHPEAGIHSIEKHQRLTKCGDQVTTWYVAAADGKLAIRLQVAVEDGALEIDTH
jgi:hypothetical protein